MVTLWELQESLFGLKDHTLNPQQIFIFIDLNDTLIFLYRCLDLTLKELDGRRMSGLLH